MTYMGLDYGSVTVGVAISDSKGTVATPLETITRKKENQVRRTLARLEAVIETYHIQTIVLGNPKNMNDTDGERVERTLEFKEKLEKRTNLPVILWDERLTTVAAKSALTETGVKEYKQKKYVDALAATLILQGYLDSKEMDHETE